MYCLQQYSKQWKWYSAEHKKRTGIVLDFPRSTCNKLWRTLITKNERELYWTFHTLLAKQCLRIEVRFVRTPKKCIRVCECMHMYVYIFFFASGHCVGNAPVTSKSFTLMLEALCLWALDTVKEWELYWTFHTLIAFANNAIKVLCVTRAPKFAVFAFSWLWYLELNKLIESWISMDSHALHSLLLLSRDVSKHLGSCFDEMFPFDDSRWTVECYMSPDWWSSVVSRTLPDLCVWMCCPWICQNSFVEILHSGT